MHSPNDDLPAQDTRRLLRQLRDLNLSARLEVATSHRVAVRGCLTLDSPVELGVAYRLHEDATPTVLHLVQQGGDVVARLESKPQRELLLGLVSDGSGRATSETISAQVDLNACDALLLEQFLRRLVRGLYAA